MTSPTRLPGVRTFVVLEGRSKPEPVSSTECVSRQEMLLIGSGSPCMDMKKTSKPVDPEMGPSPGVHTKTSLGWVVLLGQGRKNSTRNIPI